MPHDIRAVANHFIEKNGTEIPSKKIQKLAYLANGWNLAVNDSPLATGVFEAWENGPVNRQLYVHVRYGSSVGNGKLSKPNGDVIEAAFSQSELAVLDAVWEKYGQQTGEELSDMTHQPGTPWTSTYLHKGKNGQIDNSMVRDHFIALAIAGREAAAT